MIIAVAFVLHFFILSYSKLDNKDDFTHYDKCAWMPSPVVKFLYYGNLLVTNNRKVIFQVIDNLYSYRTVFCFVIHNGDYADYRKMMIECCVL
jgi:hypothetical protein